MDYRDLSQSIDARTDHLLSLMTTDEKIGQLVQLFGWKTFRKKGQTIELTETFQKEVRKGLVGALYGTLRADPWTQVTLETGLSPKQGAEAINVIQKFVVEQSRLGIPILIGEECSHGHMAIGATVFPVPLLIGSTWNTELYERMCRAVAIETRSQGGHVTYSPVLDVVRDPRWGRTEENFSEDPYLIGEFAVAAVRGMQGDHLSSPDSIGVTLKHFVAYGSSEGGRNAAPVHMGLRELHEVDLAPFRKGVKAGALSVMTAYNEIDGVPCTSNEYLLRDILRREWGFDGFVITDCGAINMLEHGHNVAESGEHASAMSIKAGVDMEMSGEMFRKHLMTALEQGQITLAEIEEATRRVLQAKFRLGLFENPYADSERAAVVIGSAEHADIAREIATEGIILLKNEQILPLSKSLRKMAVIGPNADQIYNQLGDYTSPQQRESICTVLDGIKEKAKETGMEVAYAPGCRIKDATREGFSHAVKVAKDAELIVLVLGSSSARDFGEGTIDLRTGASLVTSTPTSDMDCGEGIDRVSLALSGVQLELAQELYKLGKPLVVIYVNGRPIAEPWLDDHAHAIVEAWYPGQEGGRAVADILFGDACPSGKLTLTIPKHTGQVPHVYNSKRTRGRYLETDMTPQYPFGFGLSYTQFAYDELNVEPAVILPDGKANVSVKLTNIGDREGMEVVQLYISDVKASVTRPEQELKGFAKMKLQPGETRIVSFELGAEHLQLINPSFQTVVEPGEFRIRVGGSSVDFLEGKLTVQA